LAEPCLPSQDLDVWPDFAVEMSSRKLFFQQSIPSSPAHDRTNPYRASFGLATFL
jgi:hypothetical protein